MTFFLVEDPVKPIESQPWLVIAVSGNEPRSVVPQCELTSTRMSWPRTDPSSHRSDLGSGLWNQVSALCSLLSAFCSP